MTYDIDPMHIAWYLRVFNRLGAVLPTSLDPAALEAAAQKATGLSDFGDLPYREGLHALTDAINTEGKLNAVGRLGLRGEIVGNLQKRLIAQAEFTRSPELADQPIRRPIFILGSVRTGTTLLHKLMACDPANRAPLLWELITPAPRLRDEADRRARLAAADRVVSQLDTFMPSLARMHPLVSDAPEECVFALQHCTLFFHRARIPGYLDWMRNADLSADYAQYKRYLQILQSQDGERRWVLKAPFHLWSLPAILSVFPDACFVMTHRDMARVVPSLCTMMALARRIHSDQVDLHQVGRDALALWGESFRRMLAARQTLPPDRFFDVDFRAFTADPLSMIRRLYAHFGDALSNEAETRMQSYLRDHAPKERTSLRYDLGMFGITQAMIEDAFREYLASPPYAGLNNTPIPIFP